jgi:methionyl-tRNA formyltransferase
LRCVEELDAGPIYLKRPLSLEGTAEEILQRAADLTGIIIEEILTLGPAPTQQSGTVTRFQRRRPEDGNLSSRSDLQQVYDFIRMLDADGYPAAFLETEHFRVEFTKAAHKTDAVLAHAKIVMKSDD